MTNKEKYKKAFSVLRPSENLSREVEFMSRMQKKTRIRAAAAAVAACVIIGGSGTAYAANVGGIQRTIQLWIRGDQTQATLTVSDDGTYNVKIPDESGKVREQSGGGVAVGADGEERPVTEAEIREMLNAPEVEYLEDGTVWVYYKNQKMEITDKFDGDGICYVKIDDGKEPIYMTVKYQNGYATSRDKYPSPKSFN